MRHWLQATCALAIAAFFAVMWGLLIRANALPRTSTLSRPFYDRLLKAAERPIQWQWRIVFQGRTLGRSVTQIRRQGDGTIGMHNQTELQVPAALRVVMALPPRVDVRFDASVSAIRGLLSFSLASDAIKADLLGTVQGDQISLQGTVGRKHIKATIPYDENMMVTEFFSPLATLPPLKRARPGQQWTFGIINPFTGTAKEVTAALTGFKTVPMQQRQVKLARLVFNLDNQLWVTWADLDGEVVVQGTPFGITLVRDDVPPEAEALLPTVPHSEAPR